MFLLLFALPVMSARTPELVAARVRDGRCAERFSGEPRLVRSSSGPSMNTSKRWLDALLLLSSARGVFPKQGFQGVRAALKGDTNGVKPLFSSAVKWKAGLQALASGNGEKLLAGDPRRARILLRWFRRLVFGDTDIGALTGRLNTTAGVSGSASGRAGEDERRVMDALVSRLSFVGLSNDELLIRAISASARPLRMRGRIMSASEVGWWCPTRAAEDSIEDQ